jgi:nitroimidazol reductase NimA-like FMN-containing flavoprotein (pyridoxamine 5'-phosphate oxidase superfamily)/GNAT superfamily N-acetyltransferase
MRRETYRMDRARAVALLERAPVIHLATTTPDGEPVLRTVHGVVVGGAVCFHGAPAGEKAETLGRAAVVSAEEIVAEIPSYFLDPERACPATTYYQSVQVHGVLEAVDDPDLKARVLQALMARFQPEGGHAPITAGDPRYRGAVRGILIVRISLEKLDGKGKLGQNRKPEELRVILDKLWQRGSAADPRAIELLREANPEVPTPAFLTAPAGVRLSCHADPRHAPAAARLLDGTYWNGGFSPERLARALLASSAWVTAHDEAGTLIGTARAMGDGAKHAWLYDVIVAGPWRGRGVAQALIRLLLDHPAVRGARFVRLATRDAQRLYRRFGFVEIGVGPSGNAELVLDRGA